MKPGPPIRIFADAHVFDGEYQGTRTFIREVYTILSKKKDIELYLGACDTANLRSFFPGSSNINFIQYNTKSGLSRLLLNIPALLRNLKIDFVHFQYIIPPVKYRKCKYIVTIHDVIFKEYPEEFSRYYRYSKKMLYQHAATNADIITTVSDYSKRSIEKHLGVLPGKTEVIPNGVNDIFFQPYNKPRSAEIITREFGIGKFILYVSRFEPRKNHTALLKAWLELQLYNKGYHLVLIGHRSLHVEEFDKLLETLPAEIRKFVFIDHKINDATLLELYRAAALFVYPSKAEGFGIPALEAAALKTPVICSNASAMKEFTFFGDMHIDCSDYDLLKKKITDALSHTPDRTFLQKISDTIRSRYSWEESAEKFYRLIQGRKILSSVHKRKPDDKLSVS